MSVTISNWCLSEYFNASVVLVCVCVFVFALFVVLIGLSLVFEIFGWSSLLRMKAALGCISMLRCERNGFQAV